MLSDNVGGKLECYININTLSSYIVAGSLKNCVKWIRICCRFICFIWNNTIFDTKCSKMGLKTTADQVICIIHFCFVLFRGTKRREGACASVHRAGSGAARCASNISSNRWKNSGSLLVLSAQVKTALYEPAQHWTPRSAPRNEENIIKHGCSCVRSCSVSPSNTS